MSPQNSDFLALLAEVTEPHSKAPPVQCSEFTDPDGPLEALFVLLNDLGEYLLCESVTGCVTPCQEIGEMLRCNP